MTLNRRRVLEVLLAPEDEQELLSALQHAIPTLQLFDNRGWTDPHVTPVCNLDRCSSVAALWDPQITPTLPTSVRSDGTIHGPQVGPGVVQWLRSSEHVTGVLQAGRFAASFRPDAQPQTVRLVKTIWKVIDSHTDNKLVLAGPIGAPVSLQQVVVPGFRIGRVARQRALSGSIELATGLARLMPSS